MRRFLIAGSLLLGGCESLNQACTLIGCQSGLRIQFTNTPTAAYSIEARIPGETTSKVFDCPVPAQCVSGAFFLDFTPSTVVVTITSGTTTRSLTVDPSYTVTRPNGQDCPPTCSNATVIIPP
jgi:hypothetical protein